MPQCDIEIVQVQFENARFLPEVVNFLNEGKTITLSLRGYSMRPFLEDNRDKALLKKAENPQVGEPVLAEVSPKHYVLHRIINIDGNKVTLRGDGNIANEYCTLSDVKAQVIGFYRKGRNKLDLTSGWKWRMYSKLWMGLYPVRHYLLSFYRRIWIPLFGTV